MAYCSAFFSDVVCCGFSSFFCFGLFSSSLDDEEDELSLLLLLLDSSSSSSSSSSSDDDDDDDDDFLNGIPREIFPTFQRRDVLLVSQQKLWFSRVRFLSFPKRSTTGGHSSRCSRWLVGWAVVLPKRFFFFFFLGVLLLGDMQMILNTRERFFFFFFFFCGR